MGNTCQIILYSVPVFCLQIFVVMYYLISFLRAESWSLYMASSPQFDTACSLPRTILMAILTPLICNIHVYQALSVWKNTPISEVYIHTHIYCGKTDLENVLQSYVCVEGHFHVMVGHGWLVWESVHTKATDCSNVILLLLVNSIVRDERVKWLQITKLDSLISAGTLYTKEPSLTNDCEP